MPTPTRDKLEQLVPWDRHMGLLSLAMWGGTAVKVYPKLSLAENLQSGLGWLTILVVAVLWPTLGRASYVHWRVPAVSFLRVALFALPFDFSTAVFDAMAPEVNRGRLALVSNTFQVFMSTHIALLNFTSVGWRVPFRLHLLLHTVNVWMLARFGLHPYCRSKLLTSPEIDATVAALHSAMAFLAMVLVPSTSAIVPAGAYAQRVAALFFCWAVLGWLLPTLLLLPDAGTEEARPPEVPLRRLQRLAAQAAELLEAWLRMLLPSRQPPSLSTAAQQGQRGQHAQLPCAAARALHWWVAALVTWGVSCTAAPLFRQPA